MTLPEGTATAGVSRTGWRVIAAALAAFHVAYVLFVVFGALLTLVWPPVMWIHLAAVAWAGGTMIGDLGCPVTTWEKDALRRAGREPYPEGFLQHHVIRRRFDERSQRKAHVILGAVAIAINIGLYLLIL